MRRVAFAFCAAALLAGCESPGRPARGGAGVIAPTDLAAFFDCVRTANATLVAAHRGGPEPGYPENALETLTRTLAEAPVLMEVDVVMTADGALVLMHDDTLDRTTTGSGPVRDRTLADLAGLHLEDERGQVTSARIPTLEAALAWAEGRTVLELDVKRGVPFDAVVRAVEAADAENRVIVIVYNHADAVTVHRLNPRLMLSASIRRGEDLDALARDGVDLSRVLAWTGTEAPNGELNAALRARGVEPLFGTLGGASSWDRRIARGELRYWDVAAAGVAMIASDAPREAEAAIDSADGPGRRWERCVR